MSLTFFVVEVTGLEPTTFWSLTRRATKLRYTSVARTAIFIILKTAEKAKRFYLYFLNFLKIFVRKEFVYRKYLFPLPVTRSVRGNPRTHVLALQLQKSLVWVFKPTGDKDIEVCRYKF